MSDDAGRQAALNDRAVEEAKLSIALSGGGYRSALFGLGALHFIYASKRSKQLHTIASVSGGSYTNARAMLLADEFAEPGHSGGEVDIRDVDEPTFREHFKPFVANMTRRSPFKAPAVLAISMLMVLLGALALLNVRWVDGIRRRLAGRWHWALRPLAVLMQLSLMPSWGRRLADSIWRLLFEGVDVGRPLGTKRRDSVVNVRSGGGVIRRNLRSETFTDPSRRLLERLRKRSVIEPEPLVKADLDLDRSVHHVFSTTDLQHGGFIYLSDDFVFSPALGFGSPAEFTLRQAVEASAAIPPVFAPVRISTDGFTLLPPDAPGYVLCADGGLHDTLSVQWFRDDDHDDLDHSRDRNAPKLEELAAQGTVLVVDGSAPLRRAPYLKGTSVPLVRTLIPISWWFVSHIRSIVLAMSNWDRRNFKALSDNTDDGLIGISIARTPFAEINRQTRTDDQRRELARLTVDWRALVRANGRVSTRPQRLSRKRAAELMYHGYVMAWAALTTDDPPKLPTLEEYKAEWCLT